jgi:hypothetical protein
MGVIVLGPGLPHAQQQGARKQQGETKQASMHGHHGNPLNRDSAPRFYLKLILQRTECFAKKTLGATCAEAEWLAKGDDARFMNDVAMRLAGD